MSSILPTCSRGGCTPSQENVLQAPALEAVGIFSLCTDPLPQIPDVQTKTKPVTADGSPVAPFPAGTPSAMVTSMLAEPCPTGMRCSPLRR